MASFDQIVLIIPMLALAASITYYAMVLKNQNKTRQTQMFMQLFQSRVDKENSQDLWELMAMVWKDDDDFVQQYSANNNPEHAAIRIANWNIYDSLGVLTREKMVDIDIVYRMLGRRVIMMWFKFDTAIKYSRVSPMGPGAGYMEDMEWLSGEMIRIAKQKGHALPVRNIHPTSELYQEYNP